jgi:hypothetical protein
LEVEGKGEWKERGAGADTTRSEDAVFTVVPTVCVSKRDFMSFFLSEEIGELLAEGSCVNREVLASCSSDSAFTRVAITFDDDDDDEDEEGEVKAEEEVKVEVRGGSSNRASASAVGSSHGSSAKNVALKKVEKEVAETSFTRIQITDDDDDDDNSEGEESGGIKKPAVANCVSKGEKQKEGENEGVKPAATAAVTSPAFTRISITDEDDSEGEEGEVVQSGTEKTVTADKAATAGVIGERSAAPIHPVPSSSSSSSSATTPSLIKASDKIQPTVSYSTTTASSSGSAGEPNSESLKVAGNEEMKNCNYPAALSLYTASLELDQSNLLTRNNRSQVYLKLNQYQNAVDDATYVILNDPSHPRVLGPKFVPSSVSPAVKKALFRRATVSET